MLDRDLAALYGVETKVLNQAVKRNIDRFPHDFRFQLTDNEKNELVTNCDRFKTLKHSSVNPHVFTEQGVSMLSSVLKSRTAIEMSVQIIRAFVQMRQFLSSNGEIFQRFERVKQRLLEHDKQFDKVFNDLEDRSFKQKLLFVSFSFLTLYNLFIAYKLLPYEIMKNYAVSLLSYPKQKLLKYKSLKRI